MDQVIEDNNKRIIELANLEIQKLNENIKRLKNELARAKLDLVSKTKIRNLASGEKAVKKKYIYPKKSE